MRHEEIAVIGMAGRFPGAPTIADFWANLRDGVESIRRLTDEELRAAGVPQAALDDPAYVRACPVLDGVDEFDAAFFGLSARDASVMDPAHRLFLEVVWEALEHAGRTALPEEGAVGVFAGSGAPYYLMDNVRRNAELMRSMGEFLVRHTNNDMNFLATRVSYELDLRGPSINIQTACSSALVSVHMACESIRRGDCAVAIAGGSTVLVPDRQGYQYLEGEILSPDGHCRPFDARSAGTVFGSGSGCVVLKRLSAALDDGDTVHAVIRGSAVNNDGALRVGFLAPGVDGQAEVVSRALEAADVPADTVTYIEAHGTGTNVGDPIEVTALNQAFKSRTDSRHFCAIGSVKSNIGHLGEAAGIAALIKAILALKHRQIPASLGFETPNPQIDFDDSPFFVNQRLRDWQSEGPRRCGVTALGAGGTNCHVLLEEAPARLAGEGARETQLFVLSASSRTALEQGCDNLAQALEEDATLDLADTAYTLALGRRPLVHRCALVARDREDAARRLRARDPKLVATDKADTKPDGVVFMFPGGGAQYARMGYDLFESEEVFRSAVEECLAIVNARLGRDLGALMYAGPADAAEASQLLERPSMSLPALFTTEYALARLFESWGVDPVALLGHSMGEYVAACLAGVMHLQDALQIVMLRGRLFESVPRGRMLSVPLSEQDLRALMPAGLDIAAVNAPELCVASGPEALIAQLEATLSAREIDSTRVRIDVAAHSAMLEPVLDEFRRFCRTIALAPPRVPFLSNVSGRWITPEQATDPEYWVTHLRSTVRFADCLETLRATGDHVLLEVGPGRTLSTLARSQRTPARHAFNSLRHPDEQARDLDYALLTLGRIWVAGVPVEWPALYDGQLRNRVPLPTYAWDHQRHWIDAPVASLVPAAAPADDGMRREHVEDWFSRASWRQTPPPPPLAAADERVLLFADEAGFGESIAAELGTAGRRVSQVSAGGEWRQQGDRFTIRAGELADYEQLLAALAGEGGLPQRVVHCWGIDGGEAPSLERSMETGFHSLLAFAQAVSSADADVPMVLDVVTSDLQRIGGEAQLDPTKALALGPARVMPREYPHIRARSIDVTLPQSTARRRMLAQLVAAEVASEPADEIVAYRGRDRFVQSVEPVQLARVASRLREGGVYLITGGLGGIGYAVAQHLARTRHAKLVLVGRGAQPARAGAKLEALAALGGTAEAVQADVTDAAQMRDVLARARARYGAVHGVFHAAGTLNDSLMPLKTRADAERVLAPKVRGTLALDAAIGGEPLDLFVLFSSVSSIAGLAGQADYTAANAFLDAFAAERGLRDDGLTIAVNWSAWRDVGMAANIAAGAGAGAGEDVHPVLGRRIWAGADAELFASQLSGAAQWVIGEHRVRDGRTLMPGTGHLEVARAVVEARPEARAVELRDVAFISALVVSDDAPQEMRVHTAPRPDGMHSLVIGSRSAGGAGGGAWQEHVTATVGYVDAAEPTALDLTAIAARCSAREERFAESYESPHMDFGPRWKNRRSIRYGAREALVTLELPARFAADLDTYRLHPALMDMATGGAVGIVPDFDAARDFYVPLSYTRLRMHGPLPARIRSHVRLAPSDFDPKELVVFDVTITDDAGRVLVEIDEFVMTRVTDTTKLQGDGAPAGTRRSHATFEPPAGMAAQPALVRWLDDAIRPAEGMAALERIAAGPALSQVYVTPHPVPSLLAEMRRPPDRGEAAPAAAKAPARFADTEARLASHAAVSGAVVLERFDRPGNRHLVAYVVPRDGESPTVSELRRFAKKELPTASVPGTIIMMESFPVGTGGAVDLAALHDPFGLADDHVAPRTPTEETIAGVWKDVLGVAKVGVRDNFFDIGGHSLLAVRAIVRIDRAVGVRLNQAIMVMQTLEQIASEVERQLAAKREREQPAAGTEGVAAPAEPAESAGGGSRGFFKSLRSAVAGKGQ
jgi:acyl transferase domain-containing protein